MKSPDLPLHYSNSFQRSLCRPKYSHEISPRSHFTLQQSEQLVLTALNTSPYDARVPPPKQALRAGPGGCQTDHLPRTRGSHPACPLFSLPGSAVWGRGGGCGRKLARWRQPRTRSPLRVRGRDTPLPRCPKPVNQAAQTGRWRDSLALCARGMEQRKWRTGMARTALGLRTAQAGHGSEAWVGPGRWRRLPGPNCREEPKAAQAETRP